MTDEELAKVIFSARMMPQPYGGIVEFLALTGQRREEVAGMAWDELDVEHRLWTSEASARSVSRVRSWRIHDLRRTCVSGMARLKIAPHVADKVINHQSGTISGVAAVYQRHEFLTERREALERWGGHVEAVVNAVSCERANDVRAALTGSIAYVPFRAA